MGLYSLNYTMGQIGASSIREKPRHFQKVFAPSYSFFGNRYVPLLLIFLKILALSKLTSNLIRCSIHFHVVFRRARNNERSTSFIYKNRVHFVDDAVVMASLNKLLTRDSHIVSQIIETKFAVRSIGYISKICFFTFFLIHICIYNPNRKAQEFINRPHPLSVTLCQVIVHSHNMHALT